MKDGTQADIQEIDKEGLIDILTEELPVLRAKIGLSQKDLSEIIGISRQTYSSIETKKRKMSWNTYLSIFLVFENNEKTRDLLEAIGAFPKELKNLLNIDRRSNE
jgi:DNA-binding XRE family transcriptional regulator